MDYALGPGIHAVADPVIAGIGVSSLLFPSPTPLPVTSLPSPHFHFRLPRSPLSGCLPDAPTPAFKIQLGMEERSELSQRAGPRSAAMLILVLFAVKIKHFRASTSCIF